jgi:hypothetical protein
MATAAQKAELTKWFKPENYEGLKGITLEAFCQEFRLRRAMYEAYEEALESDEPELMVESVNQEEVALILSGEPLLTNKLTSHKNKGYDGDQHVRPLTAGKLYQFEKQIRETGLLTYNCGGAVLLSYYGGQDEDILKIRKGQKVNITGVVYDIDDRTFNTHNNGNMAWKVIKMKDGFIN